ncbi:MAG: hypothetical protein PHF94_03005 [Methanothrix sp.]|nr:hypothetical protein [Methanothrix sp.]
MKHLSVFEQSPRAPTTSSGPSTGERTWDSSPYPCAETADANANTTNIDIAEVRMIILIPSQICFDCIFMNTTGSNGPDRIGDPARERAWAAPCGCAGPPWRDACPEKQSAWDRASLHQWAVGRAWP